MKLSIAWIFDHIDANIRSIDVADVVRRLNKSTAEIERVHTLALDLDSLHPVCLQRREGHSCFVRLIDDAKGSEIALPPRADLAIGNCTLAKKTEAGYVWASYQDWGGSRDAYLPALALEHLSDWKLSIEAHDTIFEVDNKSITNRPDLWGHRGFAREIAALFNLPLKPLDMLVCPTHIIEGDTDVDATKDTPWSLHMQPQLGASRLAIAYVPTVAALPSQVALAARLARIDMRCINSLVDITNYVMCDIGHPMHAFDAQKLGTHTLYLRAANMHESVQTLDGIERTLALSDIVITDGHTPISIAGVMGGLHTSVTHNTTSLLLEAGNFNATGIRRTAERLKLRTEASARFEKSLDSDQAAVALARYIHIARQYGLSDLTSLSILSVGQSTKPHVIEITHQFIESKLGVRLSSERVIELLHSLEFQVTCHDGLYVIRVPSFRSTKDITIPEDIVEEVGRLYGYDAIKPELPCMQLEPQKLRSMMQLRKIKQYLAYAHDMYELYSYALYDESFLRTIAYVPESTLAVQDPVSENWRQLVTSLIPNLSKAVLQNIPDRDTVRVFEWGRVWKRADDVTESKRLAGIIFDKQKRIDFYAGKAIIEDMLRICGLSVTWQSVSHPSDPWYEPYETARLVSNGAVVGYVGMMNPVFAQKCGDGIGWVFELDGDWLLSANPSIQKYVPIAKFPESVRDVSVLIGRDKTVDFLQHAIAAVDPRIVSVTVIDFFEKEEWGNQRSVSLRYVVRNDIKTLTKQEVDEISDSVNQILIQHGGTIR